MPAQVLVVDDDPAVREILLTLLTKTGYRVAEAENGDAALQHLDSGGPLPELILLDLMMPQHNGWALLSTLREHPLWQRVPVIVISSAAEAAEQAAKFQVFCLPKPYTGEALLAVVECYCAPADAPAGRGDEPTP